MTGGKDLLRAIVFLILAAAFSFYALAHIEFVQYLRRREVAKTHQMTNNDYLTAFSITNNIKYTIQDSTNLTSSELEALRAQDGDVGVSVQMAQDKSKQEIVKGTSNATNTSTPNGDRSAQFGEEVTNTTVLPKLLPTTLNYSNIYLASSLVQFPPARKYEKPDKLSSDRMNVLFIVVDDLRPQFNKYRHLSNLFSDDSFKMHTPNMDALAEKSLVLSRAYVQYSSCNPSRASFMTSRRPDTTKVWDLYTFWRKSGGNFTTMPQFFAQKGYRTTGMGKIYHPGPAGGINDPTSWTDRFYMPPNGGYWSQKSTTADFWKTVTREEREEHPLPDEEITIRAVKRLRQYAPKAITGEEPFFLAVGFLKPHLPIVIPEEFLSLYQEDEISLPNNKYMPRNFPPNCWMPPQEILICKDVNYTDSYNMNVPFPDSAARTLRRAYFSGVSYVDYLMGIVLDELKTLGLADNTIVSFIGDHGWHLGEQGYWGKHTNFDLGVQAPMMMHIPGRTDGGLVSNSIVEFTDLFPTIVEATGYGNMPQCPKISADVPLCTEGVSFLNLVDNPDLKIRDFACAQHRFKGFGMGYTIRTDRFRYTETVNLKQSQLPTGKYQFQVLWDEVFGAELYDHETDPQENDNIVSNPDYSNVKKILSDELHKQFSSTVTDLIKPFTG